MDNQLFWSSIRTQSYFLSVPHPLQTFQFSKNVVFHLTHDPNFSRMTVKGAATQFSLPDLWAALGDYMIWLARQNHEVFNRTIGRQHRSVPDCNLPFTHIKIWNHIWLQTRSYHTLNVPLPGTSSHHKCISTVNWMALGRYDPVLVNHDPSEEWLQSGLASKLLLLFYHKSKMVQKGILSQSSRLFSESFPLSAHWLTSMTISSHTCNTSILSHNPF
jgi:hypothetical protein